MRLALFLTLLAFAPPVLADPATVAAVVTWIGAHAVFVQVALVVAFSVYGSANQRRIAKHTQQDARNRAIASLQDRSATIVSAEAPLVYVYGRARVGSAVVALFTSGSNDQYKHLVCVHAAHECDAIEKIYIAGRDIGALDGNGDVVGGPYGTVVTHGGAFSTTGAGGETHNITSGVPFVLNHTPVTGSVKVYYTITTGIQPYNVTQTLVNVAFSIAGSTVTPTFSGGGTVLANISYQWQEIIPRVRVSQHLGAAGQTVDTGLQAAIGATTWPATATLDGLCYTVVRLDLNQAEFQNGIPPIEVLLRGKKLYDFRTGATAWSQNNALVLYDYLTSELCGVTSTDLPITSYITAANVCDESQTFGARYTFDGTVTSAEAQPAVLEKMAQAMAGSIVSTSWDVQAGKYVAAVATFDQTDVVGALSINPGISDADLFNGVRGQYISPENLYVATDFAPYQNGSYVTADGREKWTDIDFPYTSDKQRVHNLARIWTEDQRNAYTLKAEFSLKAWPRKVGERITFTSTLFGQVAQIYRITDKKYQPNGIIELTLKVDASSIWDFADATAADVVSATTLVSPFLISPLASLTLESGTDALLVQSDGSVISRMLASWPAATTQAVFTNGLIEIEWIELTATVGHKLTVSGSETSAFLSPVEDGRIYTVRVRAVNPYLNVKSDWTYADDHLVIGKTEPPASIQNFAIDGTIISWDEVTDVDLAGYVFKFHYGNNTDWGSANLLYNGVITQSPFDLQTLPYGVVTIMAKAVDTSGNESLITANIFTDLGDPPVANVVATIAFDPTYPAESYSACSVVGGDLVADGLDSFYGTDSQSFYDADALSFYEPGAYAQMIYTSAEFEIPIALAGSTVTLDMTTQGDDVTVEYRQVGPGAFFGDDADPFYDADGDPFFPSPPGPWLAWPGVLVATVDVYQMRVTIGAGATQGEILTMSLVIDAPDLQEDIADVAIAAGGTVIPYTKAFTSIAAVQATLQANGSGAETVEIDKTTPLAPVIRAFNAGHTSVSGSTADIRLKGY